MITFKNIFSINEELDIGTVENVAFNADCMDLLAALPDKCIDLAIVDPPYGIKSNKFNCFNEKGDHAYEAVAFASRKCMNRFTGRGKLKGRILSSLDTSWDDTPPGRNISMSFSGYRRTRLSGEATISSFLLHAVLSCGIKGSHGRISHRLNMRGQALISQARYLLSATALQGKYILRRSLSYFMSSCSMSSVLKGKSFLIPTLGRAPAG